MIFPPLWRASVVSFKIVIKLFCGPLTFSRISSTDVQTKARGPLSKYSRKHFPNAAPMFDVCCVRIPKNRSTRAHAPG